MSNTVIEFDNVGKQYILGSIGTGTLSHDLNRWWARVRGKEDPFLRIGETNDRTQKGDSHFVWALKDISFGIEQGDVVGIIGKNGAGKSTLLKILSRVTSPTVGSIKVKGRIASLLEVGTGFHPEMTGRENIFMNGSIMGMTKSEIKSKFDEIVDFAGVEKYVDTPVKRYSSGMIVRLGFAVAAHLEPEILVVDEVLAVGDAEFQKKAIGKMQDVSKGEGRTVLFVSHNMGSIRQLCTKGVLLSNGVVQYKGDIENTIQTYMARIGLSSAIQEEEGNENYLLLKDARVESSDGDFFYNSSIIYITFTVKIAKVIPSLVIGFNLNSSWGHPLARADYNDSNDYSTLSPGVYQFRFSIKPFTLSDGDYYISFDLAEKNIKCYTSDKSNLYFSVLHDTAHFGNSFNEISRTKTSIIRCDWLDEFNNIKI